MGWGGKVEERARARELRAAGWTMPDIAAHLGVSRSSVSLWTRDVPTPPMARRRTRSHTDHPAKLRARAEVAELDAWGSEQLGTLSAQAFLAAGAALYAGEGSKRAGCVALTNTNPDIVRFFLRWLHALVDVDESRLRVRLYLHSDLDLDAAEAFWSELLIVPRDQFLRPQRVDRPAAIRTSKHLNGCVNVRYNCAATHRKVMGLVRALIS